MQASDLLVAIPSFLLSSPFLCSFLYQPSHMKDIDKSPSPPCSSQFPYSQSKPCYTVQHHLHASLPRQISPHTVKPATTFLSLQRTACIFYFVAAAFNIVHFSGSCLIKTISFQASCTSDFNTQRYLLQRG